MRPLPSVSSLIEKLPGTGERFGGDSATHHPGELRGAQQNIAEQRELLRDAQAKLRDAFANISAEALAKNNEAFLTLARERFSALSAEAMV